MRLAGVFDDAFAAAGLTAIWPADDAPVLALIRAVKAGRTGAEERAALTDAARGLVAQGADHLAIACTELSMLAPGLPEGVDWTDTLDCLADAIVAFSTAAGD
ncbi:MAG: aspartate/glutamate racemase family protein [Defluviimonas denitrificans]